MRENRQYHVLTCDPCGVGVCNDDWSHLDGIEDPEEGDAIMAKIEQALRGTGTLSHKEDIDSSTWFDCELCNETTLGRGHVFVTESYFWHQ